MRLGSIEILADMYRSEIVHVLINELGNGNLSKIAVRLVADKSHCKDVAQRGRDQVGVLAHKKLQPLREISVCRCPIHSLFPDVEYAACTGSDSCDQFRFNSSLCQAAICC